MNLVPAISEVEPFYANWTLWGMLGELLNELGCDLSEWSGANDGERVSASTARAWGTAIRDSMSEIVSVEYREPSMFGGVVTEWHLRNGDTPIDGSGDESSQSVAAGRTTPPAERTSIEGEPDDPQVVLPLKERPEDQKLLERFVKFCIESGGFEQQ